LAKRINIFKAGKHTSSNGVSMDFTESMLQACVDAYDPSVHEAPIVVGHPKEDSPAYGWIGKLNFTEGDVDAEPTQVDPEFAELVAAGRFKKVSASFYLPDSPSNPKPGVLYLRHVGFLGAQPPAIKGLKTASFASQDQGIVEFVDWSDSVVASTLRRIREFIIEKFSLDDADKVIPDYSLQSLEDAARQEPLSTSSYSEALKESMSMTPEELAAAQAKLLQDQQALAAREQTITTKEASFAEREQSLSTKEQDAIRNINAVFVDALIAEGKMLPVHKEGAVSFMSSLNASGVVEFGEGDSKQSVAALDWFKDYLQKQPKVVSFGEIVKHEGDDKVASFSAPAGFSVDQDSIERHSKALEYCAKNPDVSYIDAVKAVSV
jgi:hypothetical protein